MMYLLMKHNGYGDYYTMEPMFISSSLEVILQKKVEFTEHFDKIIEAAEELQKQEAELYKKYPQTPYTTISKWLEQESRYADKLNEVDIQNSIRSKKIEALVKRFNKKYKFNFGPFVGPV